jgi:peptidoglycan/LPS O-acetylase OafA/YrhL
VTLALAPATATRWTQRLRAYLAMPRSGEAIAELDGLRALAILFVLFRHGVRPFWKEGETLLPFGAWDFSIPLINGWVGVDLFFVLSGFLITHHICGRYRRRDGRIDFKDYLWRRILRIVPAYYVVVLLVALGLVPYLNVEPGLMPLRVAYHLLFLQDYLPSNLLATFWSLGVEEKFYLLSPLLLVAVFRLPRPAQQYSAIAALAALPILIRYTIYLNAPVEIDYVTFFKTYRCPFHASFEGLAMGMFCALLYRDRAALRWMADRRIAHGLFWLGAAIFTAVIGFVPLLDHIAFFDKVPLQSLLSISAGALLLGLILKGGPGQIFRSRPLLVLSRLAYSLYLVHLALLPAVQAFSDSLPFFDGLSRGAQFLVFLPSYLLTATAAALVLHYGVEKPFLLLREHRPAAA